jgi:biopolymer transport protein ExbD
MDFRCPAISYKTIVMSSIENKNDKRTVGIDFAPMVDLGFLLITFFIYTTTLMEQKAFGLNVPAEGGFTNSPVSSTITLTLKENGAVDYLEGNKEHILAEGTAYLYGKPSLRDHLINKRQRIISQSGNDSQYTVIIQPTVNTNYKEVVDVLDEMTITGINKYVLVDDKAKQ